MKRTPYHPPAEMLPPGFKFPKAYLDYIRQEDIPELYSRSFNPSVPVICTDEQPVQLIEEKRNPTEMIPGQPQRYDYEYKRNGTAEIFMFTEPLGGFRSVSVREHKTGSDRAYEVKELRACNKIT